MSDEDFYRLGRILKRKVDHTAHVPQKELGEHYRDIAAIASALGQAADSFK